MIHQFEVNGIYDFEVVSRAETRDGRKFFLLRYNGTEGYRVKLLFPSQEIKTQPRTIKCIVREIYPNGNVLLHLELKSFFESLYKVGSEYPFAVGIDTEYETDSNGANFIWVEDEYGNRHRYYPGPGEELPKDVFRLRINEITDRYVRFFSRSGKPEPAEEVVPDFSLNPGPDVTNKSLDSLPEDIEENETTEFKSSIVFPAGSTEPDIDLQLEVIVKTIASFMNKRGGILYIGINNKRLITGISYDLPHLNQSEKENAYNNYTEDRDGYELCIRNAVKMWLGNFANGQISMEFMKGEISGQTYVLIRVPSIDRPVFFKGTFLYERAGNANQLLRGDHITDYIRTRLGIKASEQHGTLPLVIVPDESSVALKPHERITMPHPETKKITREQAQAWRYIYFHNDGGWSYDKKPIADKEKVYREVVINRHEWDNGYLMLLCYKNGCINVIKPSQVCRNKDKDRRYANGYFRESEIVAIILARPYDLIAVYSELPDGRKMVKLHKAADFGLRETMNAQGKIAINDKLGMVKGYQKVSGEIEYALSSLVEPQNRTSTSAGVSLESDAHIAEVDLLKTLPGYPFISNS
jgi:hypothetical protein